MLFPWTALVNGQYLPQNAPTLWAALTPSQQATAYYVVAQFYPQQGGDAAQLIMFMILVETPGSYPYIPAASINTLFVQILNEVYSGGELTEALAYWNLLTPEQQTFFAYIALTEKAWQKTKDFFTLFHRVTMLNALKDASGTPFGTLNPAKTGGHHKKKPAVLTPSHVTFGSLASLSPSKPAPSSGSSGLLIVGVIVVVGVYVYFSE